MSPVVLCCVTRIDPMAFFFFFFALKDKIDLIWFDFSLDSVRLSIYLPYLSTLFINFESARPVAWWINFKKTWGGKRRNGKLDELRWDEGRKERVGSIYSPLHVCIQEGGALAGTGPSAMLTLLRLVSTCSCSCWMKGHYLSTLGTTGTGTSPKVG